MKMRYYKEKKISLLGLGCMRFPTKMVDGKSVIDEEKAEIIIDYAYENGINYFDTAYMYHDGLSEDFVGKILKKYPRDSFYLTTKMPGWMAETKEEVERIFDNQLKKLQTTYFDFYLMHSLTEENFEICIKLGIYDFLKKKKDAGIIKNLGFSFHDTPKLLKRIIKMYDFDFAQIQLNYLDWEEQKAKEQYEILKENNLPCIVMEPIRGGGLADLGEKGNNILKKENPDFSIASWALRFAALKENVITVLSGMTMLEQLKDNINTINNLKEFTDSEKTALENALSAYKIKDSVPCTSCLYCQDCPKEIPIAQIFSYYNEYLRNRNKEEFISKYNEIDKNKNMDVCIKCKKCCEHCPQHIDTPTFFDIIKKL